MPHYHFFFDKHMMTHLQHFMAILKMTGTCLSSFQHIIQPVAVGSLSTFYPSVMLVLTAFPGSPGVLESFLPSTSTIYMGCLCVLGI